MLNGRQRAALLENNINYEIAGFVDDNDSYIDESFWVKLFIHHLN